MAETTENTEQQQEQQEQQVQRYEIDPKSALAKRIDDLFFKWFSKEYAIINDSEASKDTSDTLAELTKITNTLLSTLSKSKEKSAVELLNNFTAFMAGDATAGVNVIGDRPQEDHISKLIWLINVATTVSVLSGELAETKKTLDKGPLKKANVSVNNIEKVAVPIKNSKQMKSVGEFVGDVLPKKFRAVAQHRNLAIAAERRSKFGGKEFKNEPTYDTMYEAIGEALVYVSTSFFAEANRAFTEQGKRLATDKVKNFDISSLSPKEQEKFLQTLQLGFDRNVNYTVELGLLRNLNDKMILDSALCVWYKVLNDQQRQDSGFTEQDLKSLPKAIAFSRKFKTQFDAQYMKYSNLFVDGMTTALKKEQEAVEKTWFENKVTGERQFRRGRLAGHGNKFMHTAPMKWLNESLGKKSWASLWAIPKIGMLTLNILTNPTLRKVRKKLTGTLFAGLRSFAQGVAEGFTATGRSTEITYEDVIKKIKEAEDKLKKITSEDTVVTNESLDFTELTTLLLESEEDKEDDSKFVQPYKMILHYIDVVHKLAEKAISDENVKNDRKRYEANHNMLVNKLNELGIRQKCEEIEGADSSKFTEAQQLLSQISDQLKKLDDDWAEYEQKSKDYTDDARDAESGGTLQVGEKTVAICEDVFDTLNKYIARQWNLLAVHSNHADMPLCVEYTTIDTPELVKSAVKQQKVHEMTFTDWLNALTEEVQEPTEENKNNARRYYTLEGDKDAEVSTPTNNRHDVLNGKSLGRRTDAQKQRNAALGTYDKNLEGDSARRDVRSSVNGNNGKTTAKYPIKYGDKYRYHGLEIKAAKSDNSKTGFGILADRLIKISGPVTDFCEYVKAMGHEDAEKTFDNDKKDPAYVEGKDKKDLKATRKANPLESVFVSGFVLNEDIGNRIVTAADKVTDKVGDKAKSGIKWLGKGAGTGIGKVLHGMTHTGTADKDALMAKTGLTYIYDRNLNTAYMVDGANILKKHCLTKSAEASFDSIATLAKALKSSNIANARSIAAVAQSLKAFEQDIGQTKFAPCKTIIDYDLADKINNGGIADNPTTGECMIKGICIRNFDSAKEYARAFNFEDTEDIFAVRPDDAKEAETLSGEAPRTEAPAGTDKPEETSAENNADETSVDTEITSTNGADNERDGNENNSIEQTVDYGEDKSDTDAQNNEENSTNAREEKQEQQTQEKPNEEAVNNTVNTGAFKIDNAAYNKIDKTNYSRDQWQQVEKNTNRKERDNITADGKTYVDGKQKKSGSMMKQSTEVDISGLSKLFEEINNIDWKDTLNG